MHRITRPRRLIGGGAVLGALIAVVASGSASAHITIAEGEVEAGAYEILTFSVGHGCEGSPTTEVRIQLPETIPTVTPTRHALYEVEKVTAPLDPPIEGSHGEQITERVSEVVYTANTPLPDGFRDTFELSVQIPEDAAGQTLYFPTIQTCETGESAWIEIPEAGQDAGELELPAPSVVVDGSGDGHDDDAADDHEGTDVDSTAVDGAVGPGSLPETTG